MIRVGFTLWHHVQYFQHRPGAYEFDAIRDRKVKYHGSFGGPQTLITSVTIKCNEFGEPDICNSCQSPPVGDYYEYKKVHLCRKCYDHYLTTGEKYTRSYLQSFRKVRDCSNIHNHEGTNARLMLKTEKDLKKQRFREAYMSLYFWIRNNWDAWKSRMSARCIYFLTDTKLQNTIRRTVSSPMDVFTVNMFNVKCCGKRV